VLATLVRSPLARNATRRCLELVATFVGITVVTFFLVRLAPGEPSSAMADPYLSPQSLVAWRALRNDAGPLWLQYLQWLGRVVHFDFGRSLFDERPVAEIIAAHAPRTLLIAAATLVVSYAAAVPLGLAAAVQRRPSRSRLLSAGLFLAYSVPTFWLALLGAVTLAAGRPWSLFPLRGLSSDGLGGAGWPTRVGDVLWHLVLPVSCLALPLVARSARLLRTSVLEVLGQDFVRAARARGLSDTRVLWAHVLPNAALPLASLLSLDIPYVMGGSVVVERVFTIRGMGLLTFEAILRRDYPLVLGTTVLVALVTMAAMALGDFLELSLDPRSRRGRS
jgi:peptide/nickel transport system permease protein